MATELAKIVADFRTTLATEIAVGGTSGTLQSVTDSDGNTIPNGTYFLTLDGDGTQKEYVKCTVTGTALTSIRTINRQGTQASGTVRKHRIGAKVQITNFAHIKYMLDLLDGTTDFDASTPLKYDGVATLTPGSNEFCTVAYADALTSAGAPNGSTTQKGIFELATVAEQGTATANGATGAALVPANANLVKTSAGSADENKIPMLNSNGLIDPSMTGGATDSYSGVVELATGAEMAAGTTTGGTGGPLVPPNSQFTATSSGSADANKVAVLGSAGTVATGFFALTGTSGEAITAGDGLYVKASDSKLYKTDADADESTFSFVGIAMDTVGAADLTLRYAPPGHVVSGLAGLTAGSPYYITGTAGTLGTTPGSRFARVARALSTTSLQVEQPKYVRKGVIQLDSGVAPNDVTTVALGFYPASLQFSVVNSNALIGNESGAAISLGGFGSENGCVSTTGGIVADPYAYIYVNSAPNRWRGAVAKSANGFTVTHQRPAGSSSLPNYLYLFYKAESL